jgi:hypothetical protein
MVLLSALSLQPPATNYRATQARRNKRICYIRLTAQAAISFAKISYLFSPGTSCRRHTTTLRAIDDMLDSNDNVGRVAQLVEQCPFKAWVAGSSPAALTILSRVVSEFVVFIYSLPKLRCLLRSSEKLLDFLQHYRRFLTFLHKGVDIRQILLGNVRHSG